MTASVPTAIAWPLLAFMAAVAVLRYLFFNNSMRERYLNHTLAFMFASNLIREGVVQDALASAGILSVTASGQLSFVLMIFTAAEFMGFIAMWTRLSPDAVRRRQRRHRVAAVLLSAGFWLAATPARAAGQTLEAHGGWRSVLAWSLYVLPLCILGAQLTTLCLRELKNAGPHGRERFVAMGGVAIGLSIGLSSIEAPILAALEQLGWLYSQDYRLALHGFIFFYESVLTNILAAIPFILTLFARSGFDITSRRWRRLQPLRHAMLTAVPQAAFELRTTSTTRRKSPLELHQATVQIRDAILQLRPYYRDVPSTLAEQFLADHSVPDRQRNDAIDALQLALAAQAKYGAGEPTPIDASAVLSTRSTTLDEETAELLRLARWWPQAEATANLRSEMSDTP